MTDTTIVVPCHNQTHPLDACDFLEFLAGNPRFQLLFVNDGSQQSTGSLLREMHEANPGRCDWIDLRHQVGVAEAVRQGVLDVFHKRGSQSGRHYVGVWSASSDTPLETVSQFSEVLDHHSRVQFVVGTRLSDGGRQLHGSMKREWLGRLYARLNSSLFQLPMRDVRCDAKLLRCTSTTKAIFSEAFRSSRAYNLELLLRLRDALGDESDNSFAESLWEFPMDQQLVAHGPSSDRRMALNSLVDYARIAWNYNFGSIERDDDAMLDPSDGQLAADRFSSSERRCEDLGRLLVEDRGRDDKDDSASGQKPSNPRYVIHMDRIPRQ